MRRKVFFYLWVSLILIISCTPKNDELSKTKFAENWLIFTGSYGLLRYEFRLPPSEWEIQNFSNGHHEIYFSNKELGVHVFVSYAGDVTTLEQEINDKDTASNMILGEKNYPHISAQKNVQLDNDIAIQREEYLNITTRSFKAIVVYALKNNYFIIITLGNIHDYDPDPNVFKGSDVISQNDRILIEQIISTFEFSKVKVPDEVRQVSELVARFEKFVQEKNKASILKLFTPPQTQRELKAFNDITKELFSENTYRLDSWKIRILSSGPEEMIVKKENKYFVTVDETRSNWYSGSQTYQRPMGILVLRFEIVKVNDTWMVDQYYPIMAVEEPFETKYAGLSRW